jgi:hypothetical protein
MILCYPRYVASAVPREGQAYRSLLALECSRSLIVLNERGRVAKDEVFDEIT